MISIAITFPSNVSMTLLNVAEFIDPFPGPFKYLPFKKSLGSIIVGMSIHGFGLGASVVGGFSDAHKSAIKAGFPDTIDTYGLVSGLWTSVFAFGAFVGEREHNIWIRLLHLSVQVLLLVAFSLMQ